jgi:hypothetical protein
VRSWTRQLSAYGEQYERWINVGQTATDFFSYLIAFVSASAEDALEQITQQSAQSRAITLNSGKKPPSKDGGNMPQLSYAQLSIGWPMFDLWRLRTRRLDETMQMASSDMQHWMRRLMQSWSAALIIGSSAPVSRKSRDVRERQ